MARPNYHHARKQRELARKARQEEKQRRRSARQVSPGEAPAVSEEPGALPSPTYGDPK